MASLLAIFSSILWGSADFFGGKLSKRYQALAVTAVSQAFGLLIGVTIMKNYLIYQFQIFMLI